MRRTIISSLTVLCMLYCLRGSAGATRGPEDPGERLCLGGVGFVIPNVEYFSGDGDQWKWGLQFVLEPTFFFSDYRTLNAFISQVRMSYTCLFSDDDVVRLQYVPFITLFNTLAVGVPLGGYYYSGDFGYSTGGILDIYLGRVKYGRFTVGYEYHYNPETGKNGSALYCGIRLNAFFFSR